MLCSHLLRQTLSLHLLILTLANRFLLISVREGTQPTNQLWYVDLQSLPEFSKEKAIDFAPYDYKSGPKALPVVKLVDNFEAAYDYLANEGFVFTFQTNYNAPLYRSVHRMQIQPWSPYKYERFRCLAASNCNGFGRLCNGFCATYKYSELMLIDIAYATAGGFNLNRFGCFAMGLIM